MRRYRDKKRELNPPKPLGRPRLQPVQDVIDRLREEMNTAVAGSRVFKLHEEAKRCRVSLEEVIEIARSARLKVTVTGKSRAYAWFTADTRIARYAATILPPEILAQIERHKQENAR